MKWPPSQGIADLACLGDCQTEAFRSWLEGQPERRLYWVYDFFGPEMPAATQSAMALELPGNVFVAHTRALLWTHFKGQIGAYLESKPSGRPPLLLCHGHTHVPSLTHFRPPVYRLLYINDAVRPQEFLPNQACIALEPDTAYLLVPGALTLEEGRFPTFSFAVLDLQAARVAMVSFKDLAVLETLELFGEG